MKIDYSNKTNFRANIIAQSGNLKICELTGPKDILFLKEFAKRTDFQKLMPGLSYREANRWHEMLEYAIGYANNPLNKTYLTISDNKLCGIITAFQDKTTFVDCICTIPIKVGQKVKLAGKTLFYQIFKDFIEYNGSRMELSAIVNGPYDTISKYNELGFKKTSDVSFTTVKMSANKYAIKDAMERLKKIIKYKSLPNIKINLNDTIIN